MQPQACESGLSHASPHFPQMARGRLIQYQVRGTVSGTVIPSFLLDGSSLHEALYGFGLVYLSLRSLNENKNNNYNNKEHHWIIYILPVQYADTVITEKSLLKIEYSISAELSVHEIQLEVFHL